MMERQYLEAWMAVPVLSGMHRQAEGPLATPKRLAAISDGVMG